MRCIYCNGYVPLAEPRGSETWCVDCGKSFREVNDFGWWGYSCEIYVPKENNDANPTRHARTTEKRKVHDRKGTK